MGVSAGARTTWCAAGVSTRSETADAAAEACATVMASLGTAPDLACLFLSPHHAEDCAEALQIILTETGSAHAIGCTGESIVANDREYEEAPALAVWCARLPGTTLTPMRLDYQPTPEGPAFSGWPDELIEHWPAGAGLLLLGDPFTFPADVLLERLNEDHPDMTVLGGMCSAGRQPGDNRLFADNQVVNHGAVGLLIHGAVGLRSLVSQGCRPIGQPYVVTKAERNLVEQLGGKPALDQLRQLFERLPEADQRLARQGLHLGRAIDAYRDRFDRGDFLIRNVMGVEPESGVVVIGDHVRTGQTVQFQVRDAASADEDLRQLLARAANQEHPMGGLLFTCNGRGRRLFGKPHHDAAAICEYFPSLPVVGFFAAGEIGPIGGKNFLHGFTASLALFSTPPA